MDWDSFRLYSSEQYDSIRVFAGLVETIYSLWGDAEDLFRKLLKSSTAKYTFSAEIVSCVDDIIEKLIKEKEERDNTYYK
ncbi:MAG: hypothetical protein HUU56_02020 [Bdellovibrionaceae bacterium]|nr:hypothetical protein [Pseudobdellovibrionaceae bacterium]